MTVRELSKAIGSKVRVYVEKLQVNCEVVDVKQAFGSTLYLVRPLDGAGTQWVDSGRAIQILASPDV